MNNYFTLFGLEPSMLLDETALHAAYIAGQQANHPDRLVGKSGGERMQAANLVADLNMAYQALKKPLTRAEHLLALNGLVVNRDGADEVRASTGLLMQQMDDSERLEGIASLQELQVFASEIETRYTSYVMKVTAMAAEDDWQECAQFTIALKYMDKILERIRRKLKKL